VKSCESHTGAAAAQSEFARQETHRPSATRQRGWLAGQSPSAAHCTQRCVLGLQIFCDAGQSLDALHPTQAPDDVQIDARVGQLAAPPSDPHAAWQV
jgi:hypothetical protein